MERIIVNELKKKSKYLMFRHRLTKIWRPYVHKIPIKMVLITPDKYPD